MFHTSFRCWFCWLVTMTELLVTCTVSSMNSEAESALNVISAERMAGAWISCLTVKSKRNKNKTKKSQHLCFTWLLLVLMAALWFVLCAEFHKSYCKTTTAETPKHLCFTWLLLVFTAVWFVLCDADAPCCRPLLHVHWVFQFTQCHQDVRGSPQGQLRHDPTEALRRSVPSSPTVLWG